MSSERGDKKPEEVRPDAIRYPSGASMLGAATGLIHRFPFFEEIGGWLSLPEGALLYDLASMVVPGNVIVEVGSYRGKSTTALALGARPGVRVYAFDPHEAHVGSNGGVYGPKDMLEFNRTMEKANTCATIFPMSCGTELVAASWKKPVQLAFIDGDHTYEGCRLDADGWIPHVVNGGYLVFDDVNLDGPGRVMKEVAELTDWTEIGVVGKVGFLRKTDPIAGAASVSKPAAGAGESS